MYEKKVRFNELTREEMEQVVGGFSLLGGNWVCDGGQTGEEFRPPRPALAIGGLDVLQLDSSGGVAGPP